jgi:hypothetical protein
LELAKLKKTEVTIVEVCKAAMSDCRSFELKVISLLRIELDAGQLRTAAGLDSCDQVKALFKSHD